MLTLRIPQLPKPAESPPPVLTPEPPALRPTLATPRFARGLTTLSVSWLPGRIEAVAITRGEASGHWEKVASSDDTSAFGELLLEAVGGTGFRGSTVHLLLAHPRLTHQLVETPPARGAALQALVRRQVERLKGFEGSPAWSYQPALPTKNSHGVLVHLFPWNLLGHLIQGAQRAGLHLVSVVPFTAVLHAQVGRLPLKRDDVALVLAGTGAMVTMVVARQDGGMLLARSVDAARAKGADGLSVELNRTLIFVAQQFGTNVGSLWLCGVDAAAHLAELRGNVQVPVQIGPEEYRPFYWSEEAARLSLEQEPNLISSEQRRAPQRQVLLRITVVSTLLLVIAAIAATAFFQVMARREQGNIRELQHRLAALQNQHQDLQRVHERVERQELLSRTVVDDRPIPVPVWFLAYLSEVTPPELCITNLSVARNDSHWEVRMEGVLPVTNSLSAAAIARPVNQLAERLHGGPFHFEVGTASDPGVPGAAARKATAFDTIANWAARLAANRSEPAAPPPDNHFVLQGITQ